MRNARHFEDCENSVLYLKFSLVKSLFEWVNAFGPYFWSNMLKVIASCSFCACAGVPLGHNLYKFYFSKKEGKKKKRKEKGKHQQFQLGHIFF